jgi:hypothetical protein
VTLLKLAEAKWTAHSRGETIANNRTRLKGSGNTLYPHMKAEANASFTLGDYRYRYLVRDPRGKARPRQDFRAPRRRLSR